MAAPKDNPSRNGDPAVGDVLTNEYKCLYCGRFLTYAGTGRPPRFCSSAHKSAHHRGKPTGQTQATKNCEWCGIEFIASASAKYHSASCRQAAYESRRNKKMAGGSE